jgi:hypothetical protein
MVDMHRAQSFRCEAMQRVQQGMGVETAAVGDDERRRQRNAEMVQRVAQRRR